MSLLTRCPACATLYRVVPDQLRISEGWVKCGHCAEIFDASKHLIEADCEPAAPLDRAVASPAEPEPPEVSVAASAPQMPLSMNPPDPVQAASQDAGQVLLAQTLLETGDSVSVNAPPEQAEDFDSTQALEALRQEQIEITADISALQSTLPPEPLMVRWDDDLSATDLQRSDTAESANGDADVSFLRARGRQAFWRRPLVRGGLMLLAPLLAVALLGQWVYFERDRLAAERPVFRPALFTFCQLVQCELQPLKRIESLTVDAVAFKELGKGAYRLSFSVKNSNVLPLAVPAAELTLTDAQEQPVFRRVFSSRELGALDPEIGAGAEWPVLVTFKVSAEPNTSRVLGYRLMVFYP